VLPPYWNDCRQSRTWRGKEFERAAKWFLETDPAYASELREVWIWDDWPGRWGPDIGIDLVAETREGNLWAIQVKCYDPESQVPTSEIDSFISASSRPEFGHRLLISTGQLSKNAMKLVEVFLIGFHI